MGQRIGFYKNNFGKGLKDLLFENYENFRKWYLETQKSSLIEFNEPFGNENLKLFFKENLCLTKDFSSIKVDEVLFNELVSEFIVTYCGWTDTKNNILELCGSQMYTSSYFQSSRLVQNTKDREFIQLWNYIIQGRSLITNNQFVEDLYEIKIGYLTFEEQKILKQKIEDYFGKIENIKKKYWTFWEKIKEKKAREKSKDGSYSLSGHKPKIAGLEYVLHVLEEVENNKNELISEIE
jgi:hypothetical protein